MRSSEHLDQLVPALVAAQAEFPTVTKGKVARVSTKNGGEYSYRYADLPDILTALQPTLAKHGLAVVGLPDTTADGKPALTTRLLHTSGQWLEGSVELHLSQDTPQGQGSAITYARRYGFCGVLNIAADEDDDAALASGESGQAQQRADPNNRGANEAMATEAQLRNIGRLFDKLGVSDRSERLSYVSAVVNRPVASSKELSVHEASAVIDRLEHDCRIREGQ